MSKKSSIFFANLILVFHAILFAFVFLGWFFPDMRAWYALLLALILASDLAFGYCILSKWEFDLRKKANPKIEYDFSWTIYYLHRITKRYLPGHIFKLVAVTYLCISLFINVALLIL